MVGGMPVFSRKLMAFVALICGLKIIGTGFAPFYSSDYWGVDFYYWVSGARAVLLSLSQGTVPSFAVSGAYTGLFFLLAPFFWLWTVLPISHPSLAQMVAEPSTGEYLLSLIMKIPIVLSELVAGILIALLVQRATHSEKAARKAFFVWYLNPFNMLWMYYFTRFDVIPTSVLLLAVLFGNSRQWLRSGFCLAVAGMLRLFPFLLLPFFVLYSLRDKPQSTIKLLASFLAPVILVLLSQLSVIASFDRLLMSIVNLPLSQNWLLSYYGFSIAPGLFKLTPFLLVLQFYFVGRHWKMVPNLSLVHFSIAPLLVLFAASYTEPYHFIWVSPFLTAYYMIEKDRLQLFILTFVFASLFVAGFTSQQPLYPFLPLLAGFFYGSKAAYLLKLNLGAMRPQLRRVLMGLRISHGPRRLYT
jgi:hypothetical protein